MFGDYLISIRVRLNSDLTHYYSGLACGLLGVTLGNAYQSDTYDAVINVYFDNGITTSIVLDKLDIIDEEYLSFLIKRENKFLRDLKEAKNIVKEVGPRGGFKKLSLTTSLGNLSFYDRRVSTKIEEKLKKLRKKIEEKIV